jgi:hypothetical protein
VNALAILREGRPDSLIERGRGYSFAKILPRIECGDGFNVSVQAGELLYSTPREDHGPWSHVEVGYPSERPEPWADWEGYAEEADRPTTTVYGYVPLELVEALIASHGGIR